MIENKVSVIDIIEKSLENSFSYKAYRAKVAELLEQNHSTGNDPKNKGLLDFSNLNNRRMKRLDKTLKMDAETISSLDTINSNINWIVITEGWCGDAAQSLPVINKVAELVGIDLKIVLRDDNEDLINQFLTNGGQAIPILIAYDEQNKQVVNSWGPRPTTATKLVNDYKEEHGRLTPEFKQDLQIWYNKNKGKDIISDLVNL